jgi:hypothetical protein
MEEAFASLKAPLRHVTGPDIPVPAIPPPERFYIPNEAKLIAAVKEILQRDRFGGDFRRQGVPAAALANLLEV